MEESFRALLQGDAGVLAVVPAARINWGERPTREQLPAIVLTLVSGGEGLTLDGPDGLAEARVQVDCYGATFAQARAVADAVRARLHGYSGGAIQLIDLALERAATDAAAVDRPTRRSLDFRVIWSRS